MIYCPACNASNRDGSKFCNDCGSSLGGGGVLCPSCQTRNPITGKYCSSCGFALFAMPPVAVDIQPAIAQAPLTLTDIEDELPSLEADVPSFAEPDSTVPAPPTGAIPAFAADAGPFGPTGQMPTLPDGIDLLDEAPPWIETGPAQDAAVERVLPDWLALSDVPIFVERVEVLSTPAPGPLLLPSWLNLPEEAAADVELPYVETVPEPRATELPSWLLLAEPAPAQSETVGGLPDWLEMVEPPYAGPPLDTALQPLLPDWLTLPEPAPLPTPAAPDMRKILPGWLDLAEPVLPDWLMLPEPIPTTEAPASGVLPDWLSLPEPEAFFPPSAPIDERTLPEWLSLPEPAPAPPAAVETVSRVLPDWLAAAEETAEPAAPKALPDWLSLPEQSPAIEHVIPDWLLDEDIEETAPPEPAAEPVAAELEEPVSAVVPIAAEAQEPASTAVETEPVDTLALPGIAMARSFRAPEQFPVRHAMPAQTPDYASVFTGILQPDAEPPVAPTPHPSHRYTFLSFLLIIVIAFPLLVPMWINFQPGQSAAEVFKIIQALPPTANVLVSFDWTAGNDDEMAPIADALLRHLVRRQVKIVAVSLVPEGAKLAQRTIEQSVLASSRSYVYGQRVVNLGYLPGNEAAIQAMSVDLVRYYGVDYRGTPAKDLPLLKEFKSVKNADLVIELAGEPEMLQKWVTQLSARYPGIVMVAGISATARPWAEPFSSNVTGQSRQLKGVITGIRGAAEYEWENNDPNDPQPRVALAALDAQSFGGVFLVLVIVFGNLAHLLSRGSRTKGTKDLQRSSTRS